jgi:hypothetical protein
MTQPYSREASIFHRVVNREQMDPLLVMNTGICYRGHRVNIGSGRLKPLRHADSPHLSTVITQAIMTRRFESRSAVTASRAPLPRAVVVVAVHFELPRLLSYSGVHNQRCPSHKKQMRTCHGVRRLRRISKTEKILLDSTVQETPFCSVR